MKYWRGYLVAGIFLALSWALHQFAQAHSILIDMIYPYVTRIIINSLADWSGAMNFCLWQVVIVSMVILGLVSIVLMIALHWNPIQWLGWVLASICLVSTLQVGIYGLNQYASPLADDVGLTIADYNVTQLNDAAVFFRDKANEYAKSVERDKKGNPVFGTFEDLAQQAGNGFQYLAYKKAISVFSGSTAPVKKLSFNTAYTLRGDSGVTVALTGEACVNPDVPDVALPFAMCKEIAHRMSISSDADAQFGGFLASIYNESPAFQYSGYLFAYRACYEALLSIPTSTAQACAEETQRGVNEYLRSDLADYVKFFGKTSAAVNSRSIKEAKTVALETQDPSEETQAAPLITYSEYAGVADLLTSWHLQEFVAPLHTEDEVVFNPLDASQVDLSGIRRPAK